MKPYYQDDLCTILPRAVIAHSRPPPRLRQAPRGALAVPLLSQAGPHPEGGRLMSQWSREHPEEMERIASLPLEEQNDALRGAVSDTLPDERDCEVCGRPSLTQVPPMSS